jgi:hypothetical protein
MLPYMNDNLDAPKGPGRPTDYRPEYCDRIIEFFSRDLYRTEIKQVASQGQVVYLEEKVANYLPTFQKFATELGTTHKTLLDWSNKHPEFSEAYDLCKNLQYDFINQHGLLGSYKSAYCKFVATNITDMKDKTEHEVRDASIRIDKQDEAL